MILNQSRVGHLTVLLYTNRLKNFCVKGKFPLDILFYGFWINTNWHFCLPVIHKILHSKNNFSTKFYFLKREISILLIITTRCFKVVQIYFNEIIKTFLDALGIFEMGKRYLPRLPKNSIEIHPTWWISAFAAKLPLKKPPLETQLSQFIFCVFFFYFFILQSKNYKIIIHIKNNFKKNSIKQALKN